MRRQFALLLCCAAVLLVIELTPRGRSRGGQHLAVARSNAPELTPRVVVAFTPPLRSAPSTGNPVSALRESLTPVLGARLPTQPSDVEADSAAPFLLARWRRKGTHRQGDDQTQSTTNVSAIMRLTRRDLQNCLSSAAAGNANVQSLLRAPEMQNICSPDECSDDCWKVAMRAARVRRTHSWASRHNHMLWMTLKFALAPVVELWRRAGGITAQMLVDMLRCARLGQRISAPSGILVHVYDRTLTVLRSLGDNYGRVKQARAQLKRIVAAYGPFRQPVVFYLHVADVPCDTSLPYLTYFSSVNHKTFLVPDNGFEDRLIRQRDGTGANKLQLAAMGNPFAKRDPRLFFRGAPTGRVRYEIDEVLSGCCRNETDVGVWWWQKKKIAVKSRLKVISLENHTRYRYLLSMAGKVSSVRDKYLNYMNGTIVKAELALAATGASEPFCISHTIWEPYVNYIPMTQKTASCVVKRLNNNKYRGYMEDVAANGYDVGRFLTNIVVEELYVQVITEYASLQRFNVPSDPRAFVQQLRVELAAGRLVGGNDLVQSEHEAKWVNGIRLVRELENIEKYLR